jgi:exonuclease III
MRTGGRAKNIGWRLDYFVVNKEALAMVKDSTINNDVYGSDHCPIELHLLLK